MLPLHSDVLLDDEEIVRDVQVTNMTMCQLGLHSTSKSHQLVDVSCIAEQDWLAIVCVGRVCHICPSLLQLQSACHFELRTRGWACVLNIR
jgi:hypothetical protein